MAFNRANQTGATRELAIKGWTTSKLSSNPDQGLEALLSFLAKKSSRQILSSRLAGRAGSVLLITIYENDKDRFYHLNGFTFGGAPLTVEDARSQPTRGPNHSTALDSRTSQPGRLNQPGSLESRTSQPNRTPFQNGSPHHLQHQPPTGPRGGGNPRGPRGGTNPALTSEVENLIISVVRERYRPGEKHLVLNALVADPALLNSGLSDQDASKVYKAIFAICESKIWETESKRRESVESVSLRDNGIKSVQDIISLASVFPHIHNLDLANNGLEDMGALKFWKNQFRDLEHLILTGNEVASKPDTLSTLIKWYPKLKMYNNEPIVNGTTNTVAAAPQQAIPLQPQQPAALQAAQPQAPTPAHPELPPGSTFGVPLPDKPQEVLMKEQMGLQFSFETRLKMSWVETCLSANGWDYTTAMANFVDLRDKGQIPADAYLVGV